MKIFVSSVMRDFETYREAAFAAIRSRAASCTA